MKLHEAIKKVILDYGQDLSYKDIASIINELNLYNRYDNLPVSSLQIRSRVRNYPHLFYTIDDTVNLKQFQQTMSIFDKSELKLNDKIAVSLTFSKINTFLHGNSSLRSMDRLLFILQITYFTLKTGDTFNTPDSFNIGSFKSNLLKYVYENTPEYFYEKFSQNLSKVDEKFYSFFFEIFLSKIDRSDTNNFNRSLLHYANNSGELSVDNFLKHTTPPIINSLLAGFANPKKHDIIFDPASGISSTLLEVIKYNDDIKVIGNEIDPVVASFGWMFLALRNFQDYTINNINSISTAINSPVKPNIIVCDMVGMNFTYEESLSFSNKITKQNYVVHFIKMLLTIIEASDGKMIINLPVDFLYSNVFYSLRKDLILNDRIEAIITFPIPDQDLFHQKNSCIIVISNLKPKHKKDKLIFIDLDYVKHSFHEFDYSTEIKTQISEIVDNIVFAANSPDFTNNQNLKLVPSNLIEKNDFELWPKKYTSPVSKVVSEAEKNENLQLLGNLLTPFSDFDRPKSHVIDIFKEVSIHDLNDDAFGFYLDLAKLGLTNIDDKHLKLLSSSALLIAKIGLKLKPTYFKFMGETIAVSSNIFVFSVKEELVDIEYLITQLNSEFVLQQISMNRLPRPVPTLGRNDILSVRIPLPSLSEQFNIIAKSKEILSEKLTLSDFINSIHLANTPEEIKSEIERFALSQISEAKSVTYQNEFDMADFPFSKDDIASSKFVINAKEEGYKYMLLIDDDKNIYGLLIVETIHAIRYDTFNVVNSYAKFVNQTSSKYIFENTNRLLEKFSHTTKNILGDILSKMNRIIDSSNPKLQEAFKTLYIEDAELMEYFIHNESKKKESFLAFNHMKETQDYLLMYVNFFKKQHESIKNRTNDTISEIQLNDFLDQAVQNYSQVSIIKDKNSNPTILIKTSSIIHAFVDLIENAFRHGSDQKATIKCQDFERYVEFKISNSVNQILSEKNYSNLGKDDIKNDNGVYSTGLHNAFVTINEKNGIVLAPYETYKSNRTFEVIIKLKKS